MVGGATNISQGMHLMRRILTGALVTLTNVQSSLSIRCSDIDRTVSIPAGLRWLLLNSVDCDLDLRHTLAKVSDHPSSLDSLETADCRVNAVE
jgi:hypothetical protein